MEKKKFITKEDEREALKKIRDIVVELGEDSYVGTAFMGVFELAEENIENDFACSALDWKVAKEQARQELLTVEATLSEKEERVEKLSYLYDETYKRFREQECRAIKAEEKLNKANELVKVQADEIIRLKAKLYDLMTERSKDAT